MVIAIDFDGTITDKNEFPLIGEMKDYADVAIHNLQKAGHKIILWTCREGEYLYEAIRPVPKIKFKVVKDIKKTERGSGGFGHTGIK